MEAFKSEFYTKQAAAMNVELTCTEASHPLGWLLINDGMVDDF